MANRPLNSKQPDQVSSLFRRLAWQSVPPDGLPSRPTQKATPKEPVAAGVSGREARVGRATIQRRFGGGAVVTTRR
jgi:hypothetical protein